MKLSTEIETSRLILKQVSQAYTKDIYDNFTDKITTYIYPSTPTNIQETDDWVNSAIKKIDNCTELSLVITDKNTGEFIGGCGLNNINTRSPEPGIWIKEKAWGNKYGLEAVKGIVDWANKNLDFDRLIYPVAIQNTASRKIPGALGGITDDDVKQFTTPAGKKLSIIEYTIRKNPK